MNAQVPLSNVGLVDAKLIDNIVDLLYEKMLDDYRINRFFSGRPTIEQTEPLKKLLKAMLIAGDTSVDERMQLLDDYLMAAFARTNTKPNLVNGSDFAFLLDIVGGREIRTITLLCDGHAHLMKLGPDDFHYDVVMEHLVESLKQLGVDEAQASRLLQLAEMGRDGILGRGVEMLKAA